MHNKPIKTIFVCEFITGGGLSDSPLPADLLAQGQLMRDALLRDLALLPYQVITTVDARLMLPTQCQRCHLIEADDDVWGIWEELIATVDAVWLIAPETDGALAKITQLAEDYEKCVIGCGASSIALCSSKLDSYRQLAPQIATIDTYSYRQWPKTEGMSWLAKPDDGAGCEQTVCFASAADLDAYLIQQQYTQTHIIQPYVIGVPASIACVMHQGRAQLLSCNQQLIQKQNNTLMYQGCVINGVAQYWEQCAAFANQVASLLPGLAGYIGIDVILCEVEGEAPRLVLVEINPRLTSSYIALAEAMACNPAELVMNTLRNPDYIWPTIQKKQVTLEVPHD